jgi:transposase-like protein
MNWAAERIAKEVEDNERIEAKGGKPVFYSVRYNDEEKELIVKTIDQLEEKELIVKTIDQLKKEGHQVVDAARRFNIHSTTYYTWKRKLNK